MNKLKLFTVLILSTVIFSACLPKKQTVTTQPSEIEQQNPVTVSPQYIQYSDTAISTATADGGRAVLFFHANWCPTCRSAEKDILGKIDQLDKDITIIRTDYDEYEELKTKYGVTYQHTFVQVNSDGDLVTTWNGGALNEINKRTK